MAKQKVKKPTSYFVKNLKNIDWAVIVMITILLAIGCSVILSITTVTKYNNDYGDPFHFLNRQLLGVALGVIGIIGIMMIPYRWLKRLSVLTYPGNIGLLAITLMFGTGPFGVKSWLSLGPLRLQPAELVKIGLILGIASFVSTEKNYFRHFPFKSMFTYVLQPYTAKQKWRRYFVSPWGVLAYTAVLLILVMLQPDLGTGVVFFTIGVTMVLCSGVCWKTLGQLILVLSLMLGTFWGLKDFVLKDHQKERFLVWQQPFDYEQDIGYQNIGGYTAIALGGMSGSGLGDGIQKYGYVVEPHNDFIISIISEELGGWTVIFIILLYLGITLKIIVNAFYTKDLFASMVFIGVGSSLIFQTMINLGGVSGTIPLTGVTLPFVSYGGTSILTSFLLIGVYLNVRSAVIEERKRSRQELIG